MNYIFQRLIIFFFLSSCVFTQVPKSYNFFPHSVGNVWQYLNRNDYPYVTEYRITSDSVDQNGNTFLNLNNAGDGNRKWSYKISPNEDSIIISPNYSSGRLILKLPIDSIRVFWKGGQFLYARVENKRYLNLFGRPTIAWDIGYYGDTNFLLAMYYKTFAEGFGLIYEENDLEYMQLIGCIIKGDTLGLIVNVKEDVRPKEEYFLSQNYPNPFNANTKIEFTIPKEELVELVLYDIIGQKIKTIKKEIFPAGNHTINANLDNLSSGVYIIVLQSGIVLKKRKILLNK